MIRFLRTALAPTAAACLCALGSLPSTAAGVQSPAATPVEADASAQASAGTEPQGPSFGRETLEDVKLYFTAPIRWDSGDWMEFGSIVAAVGVAHAFDGRVRHHFAGRMANDGLNGGKDVSAVSDALPAAALLGGDFLVAAYWGDSDGFRETWTLIESAALSAVTAEVLSYAIGRQRPDGTTSPNRWRAGNDSFPSVHASAAFAIGTAFAESGGDDYRWLRRILGYGVAGYTIYERVKQNVHWTSDVVAGAGLGIATAQFVLDRRENPTVAGAFDVGPIKNGWQVGYTYRFR